jgi:hypothetical protein
MRGVGVSVLLPLLLAIGCAERQPVGHRWPPLLTTGVAFLDVGGTSLAVGAGLFGYAIANQYPPPDGIDMRMFVPGVAVFGVGIPFTVLGTIFTISGALQYRTSRQWQGERSCQAVLPQATLSGGIELQ